MKFITCFALLTSVLIMTSGCMLTSSVMRIDNTKENVFVEEVYLLEKHLLLVRSSVRVCTDSLAGYNTSCEKPYFRDSLWKLGTVPKTRYRLGPEQRTKCNLSIDYFGGAEELDLPETSVDLRKTAMLKKEFGLINEPAYLCGSVNNLFNISNLYLRDGDDFRKYDLPQPQARPIQHTPLVAVRYALLPFAVAADIVTGPIQLLAVPFFLQDGR